MLVRTLPVPIPVQAKDDFIMKSLFKVYAHLATEFADNISTICLLYQLL